MFLDAAQEKMLRAIAQSAVASAAAGCPFAGDFRDYSINAIRLQVDDQGAAHVQVSIANKVAALTLIIGTVHEQTRGRGRRDGDQSCFRVGGTGSRIEE